MRAAKLKIYRNNEVFAHMGLPRGGTIGAVERYFSTLPADFRLTREGEVMLARTVERGEHAILRAAASSAIDVRGVLQEGMSTENGAERRVSKSDEQRREEAARFVSELEKLQRGDLGETDRRTIMESLRTHRRLIRVFGRRLRLPPDAYRGEASVQYRIIKRALSLLESARCDLMLANLTMVARIAKKHERRGMPLLDLIQEGNIGLMRALDKFDYRMGIRFGTYAAWWVRSKIGRALAEKAQMIRVPTHVETMNRRLNAAKNRLMLVSGEIPTESELAETLRIPLSEVRRFSDSKKEQVSLDTSYRDDDDRSLGDYLADDDLVHPEEIIAARQAVERASTVLSTLRPRERAMLKLRFGIDESRSYSLQEVGDKFGISRERVRQIEEGALTKMRKLFDMKTRELLLLSEERASS